MKENDCATQEMSQEKNILRQFCERLAPLKNPVSPSFALDSATSVNAGVMGNEDSSADLPIEVKFVDMIVTEKHLNDVQDIKKIKSSALSGFTEQWTLMNAVFEKETPVKDDQGSGKAE